MSFFSSIGQYVADMADSVAGLALSPRRGPPPRHRSADETVKPAAHAPSMRAGFPRVVPSETACAPSPLLVARRRTLESLPPPASRPRGGSLRVPRPPPPPAAPTMAFCRRRLSWPEVDSSVNSGVQEVDGSYFECFTALSWRAETRRLEALRQCEARAEQAPPPPTELGLPSVSATLSHKEHEHLYTEVLYCVSNAVGAPAPGGQYAHFKDEVLEHARRAFRVPPEQHYRRLHAAGAERPPVVVLAVHVIEADGLEAKDANGFSDPYCMLGIQPASLPASPRAAADDERKHSGFRLSFKRRDGRQQRDSLGRLPARYIRATGVRPHTLSPRWDETFKFDIDDVSSDVLHLDIWDHDDESSVLDAVSRLNEVRGVRGLGRFFKQVCQSARQGSQDDFLGCVNIPLREIPSTGSEGWYRLEARSQRSSVQGRIRLRLWLSAREAGRAGDEDDNWQQVGPLCIVGNRETLNEPLQKVRQHERLFGVLLAHEVETAGAAGWAGELCGAGLTLLHQHAVQGDLSALQAALARWAAAVRLNGDTPLEPKYLHRLLNDLERAWAAEGGASRDEERWLADCFSDFVDRSMHQIRLHRDLYPALHQTSLTKLEYLLRCLNFLSQMKAFWKCCPFSKEIRGEIITALRKGTAEWYECLCGQDAPMERGEDLVGLATAVQIDLQQGLTYYHPLFEMTNNIPYFTIVFMQIDKMLSEDVRQCVEAWLDEGWCGVVDYDQDIDVLQSPSIMKAPYNLGKDREEGQTQGSARTLPFELLASLKELIALAQSQALGMGIGHADGGPQPQLYHAPGWFEALVDRWLAVTKSMALQRVRAAVQLDRVVEGEKIVKHSTSSVDTAACLYQMRSVWRSVGGGGRGGSARLLEAACAAALHYADLVHGALAEAGYYDANGQAKTVDEICVAANNLEYVKRSLNEYEDEIAGGLTTPHSDTYCEESPQQTLLRGSLAALESRALRALAPLATRTRPAIKKAVFHLAWSPDTLPTTQAITPLLEFLDGHLATLNAGLLSRNFERALVSCWASVLRELGQHADAGGAERPRVFHDRLREALDHLADFFHAEGKGLTMHELHSEPYQRIELRLQYHRTPTERLLELWLVHRLQAQLAAPLPSAYGSLFVRTYFNHDSLCIEILSARDVIPLDPNGFSDPFVIVELLPKRIFPKCTEQVTNVQKKTLNPIWDECFEYGVTLEQCRAAGAAVAFTVMDRDVLTADDFAGEAYVALSRVPGVAEPPPAPDPLRPLELAIMQLHDKQHPILQILESRTDDKVAMDFVKKQKMRFAED